MHGTLAKPISIPFLDFLSCGNGLLFGHLTIWLSHTLSSLPGSILELSFHCLFSAHFGITSWFPDSCVREVSVTSRLGRDIFSCFPAQSSPNKDRLSHVPESCLGKAGAVVIKVGTCMKYAFVSAFVALNQVNKCWLSVEHGFLWDCVRPCRTIDVWGALSNVAISDFAAGTMWGSLLLLEGGQLGLCSCKSRATSQPWPWAAGPAKMVRVSGKWLQNRFASGCCRPWSSQTGWRGERFKKNTAKLWMWHWWGSLVGSCRSGACYRKFTGNSLLAQHHGNCQVVCTSPLAWSGFVSLPLLIFSILFFSHCLSRTFFLPLVVFLIEL